MESCPRCSAALAEQRVECEEALCTLCGACGFVLSEDQVWGGGGTGEAERGAAVGRNEDGDLPPLADEEAPTASVPASARAQRTASLAREQHIQRLAATLRLSAATVTSLRALASRCAELQLRPGLSGGPALLTSAACYVLIRLDRLPLPLPAVAAAASVDASALMHAAQRLAQALGTPLPATDVPALLRRFAQDSPLRLPSATLASAQRLWCFAQAAQLDAGREPRALGAAALLCASSAHGAPLSLTEAAEAMAANPASVTQREGEMLQALRRLARALLPCEQQVNDPLPAFGRRMLPFLVEQLLPSLSAEAIEQALAAGGEGGAAPQGLERAVRGSQRRKAAVDAALQRLGRAAVPSEETNASEKEAPAEGPVIPTPSPPQPPAQRRRGQLRPLGAPRGRGASKKRSLAEAELPPPPSADAAPGDSGQAATPQPPALRGEEKEIETLLRSGVPPSLIIQDGLPRARAWLRHGPQRPSAQPAGGGEIPMNAGLEDVIRDDEWDHYVRSGEEVAAQAALRQAEEEAGCAGDAAMAAAWRDANGR